MALTHLYYTTYGCIARKISPGERKRSYDAAKNKNKLLVVRSLLYSIPPFFIMAASRLGSLPILEHGELIKPMACACAGISIISFLAGMYKYSDPILSNRADEYLVAKGKAVAFANRIAGGAYMLSWVIVPAYILYKRYQLGSL